jgi:hypothetical protein
MHGSERRQIAAIVDTSLPQLVILSIIGGDIAGFHPRNPDKTPNDPVALSIILLPFPAKLSIKTVYRSCRGGNAALSETEEATKPGAKLGKVAVRFCGHEEERPCCSKNWPQPL